MEIFLPPLEEAITVAEKRLQEKLGRPCEIRIFVNLDSNLLERMEAIDHEKFREGLWYTHQELEEKTKEKGFTAFLVYCEDQPIAFLYGYQNPGAPAEFLLDEVVTLVEGKGVGKILIVLALIHCFDAAYQNILLYTEETDDKGRKLREFYEHLGFYIVKIDRELGVVMRYDVIEDSLKSLYCKVMFKEGGPFPPFLR